MVGAPVNSPPSADLRPLPFLPQSDPNPGPVVTQKWRAWGSISVASIRSRVPQLSAVGAKSRCAVELFMLREDSTAKTLMLILVRSPALPLLPDLCHHPGLDKLLTPAGRCNEHEGLRQGSRSTLCPLSSRASGELLQGSCADTSK